MQGLEQEVSLAGKIENITMMDLRSRPGEILTSVKLGKVFVITRQGKVLGVLSKPPGRTLTTEIDSKGNVSYSL